MNVPSEEQMVKVFKRFLAATAICEPTEKTDTMIDFDDDEEGIVPIDIEEDDD